MDPKALIILCTCPADDTANRLAESLVREQLAACVNIAAPITSVYRWNGEINRDTEALLLIKSSAAAYPRLERRLREQHPYETPEIIALPVTRGLDDYLKWLDNTTCTS